MLKQVSPPHTPPFQKLLGSFGKGDVEMRTLQEKNRLKSINDTNNRAKTY